MLERIELLLKDNYNMEYRNKKILIFGVGGVGSYTLEALVRSGIKEIGICDFDKIDESNLNRQVITTSLNIGLIKVEEAKKRALSINPNIIINAYNIYIDFETINDIDFSNYDYVVDAIDTVDSKILIIKKCQELNIPIISSMGTGKRLNPEMLTITDIYKTEYCPLAKKVRLRCRKEGIKHLKVLYSKEIPMEHNGDKIGSMMFVPSSAGILIASYIIRDLLGAL